MYFEHAKTRRRRAGGQSDSNLWGESPMDVRFINPFVEAVQQLFKTMLNTELVIGKPSIRQDDVFADVSAVIGFSGDATGSVVLCFPMETAVKAASTFAGVEMKSDDEDFSDAIGELANIVAGGAKARMDGLNISISLPSVVVGTQHAVLRSRQRPRLAIPCDSSLGRFTVEVTMVVNKQVAASPQAAGAARG